MQELRFDPTVADWVVFSPLRKLRPHDEHVPPDKTESREQAGVRQTCPFCPGNEQLTPHEIYSVRKEGGGPSDWRVRVVPNKFPALRIEEDHHRQDEGPSFQYMGGCGAHEVIIESPDHFAFLGQQPVEQIELVLKAAQSRYRDLMRDPRFQTIVIFKNHGERAGTSLKHPHWQLIATPVVPRMLRQKHREATNYFDRMGRCLYCVLAEDELAANKRIIVQNSDFVAFCPFASHLPFETWILPFRHHASFGPVEPDQFRPLAEILKTVLLKLYNGLENPDFNLVIDTAPRGDEEEEYFLWHIQILPRLSTPAGFELGSGMSINTVMPEEAAAFLRDVEISDGIAVPH